MSPPDPVRLALPGRGVELATYDWGGNGALALLAHANGFCAGVYDPMVRALGDRYRVVGLEARGHGESSSPEPPGPYEWRNFVDDQLALVPLLLERTGAPRLELAIGHSFGGTANLVAATERPDLFGRLALLDPVVFPPPEERPEGEWDNPMSEGARRRRNVFASRHAATLRWGSRAPFDEFDPRVLALYAECGLRDRDDGQVELKCRREVEAAIFDMGAGFDLHASVANLRTPGHLFRATRGNPRLEIVKALVDRAPTLELVDVDLPHLFPMIEPEAVAQRILDAVP